MQFRCGHPLDPRERPGTAAADPVLPPADLNARVRRLGLQAKLTVSQADDPYEREAEQAAASLAPTRNDFALRRPEGEAPQRSWSLVPISPMPAADGAPTPRGARDAGAQPSADGPLEARIQSPHRGRPLPRTFRREMEAGFGADFSNVRVHDAPTDRSVADRLDAKAFTHRTDIWIGSGGSVTDRQLVAHELAHVMQQSGALVAPRGPSPGHGPTSVIQRQPQAPRSRVPAQPTKQEARAIFSGDYFYYLLRDDIQWHNSPVYFSLDLIVFDALEQRKNLSSKRLGAFCAEVLASGIGVKLKQGPQTLGDYIAKQIDDYGLSESMAFVIHVPYDFIRQQFDSKEYDAYLASVRAQFDLARQAFLLLASANLKAGKGSVRGSAAPGGAGQAAPARPAWAEEQKEQIAARIEDARKQTPRPKDLPDHVVLWHNERDNGWYLNVWVYLDSEGKEKRGSAIRLKPGETAEDLLARVRAATLEALQRAEDRERREAAKLAPAWAQKLERNLKSRLDELRRRDRSASDFPDGMVVVAEPGVHLQIWVERGTAPAVERNYGSVPLVPTATVDQLVPYVRRLSAVLRQYEKTPTGEPAVTPEVMLNDPSGLALAAFPSEIVPIDLPRNNVTVTGAKNEFLMSMDFEEIYGGGPLKDLYIASKLYSQRIHYYWEVYSVPPNLPPPEGQKAAPEVWGRRWQWLYDTYNPPRETAATSEPKHRAPLPGTPATKTDSSDMRSRVRMPPAPGDYLVRCITGHAPIGESKLKRLSSEAFYPVRVRPIEEVVTGAASLRPGAIAAMESELAGIDKLLAGTGLQEHERQMLLARQQVKKADLERLRRKETQSLTENVGAELAYADDTLAKVKRLQAMLPDIRARAKAAGTAPSDLLKETPELLTVYWFVISESKTIDGYAKELEDSITQLRGVQTRAGKFANELKPASPYRYNPEAALASEVTGRVYPLVLMLGEAPENVRAAMAAIKGRPGGLSPGVAYSLVDVTSKQTQKVYYGYSTKSGPEGHREAIDDAFHQFGEDATYGEGLLAVRIPPGNAGTQNPNHPGTAIKTYRSKEGIRQKVLWALGIIAAAVGVAALVATGVGAPVAAGILGAVAATAGAIVALHNIEERQRRHTLEFDAELVLDVVSVLALVPAVVGARAAVRTAAGLRTAIVTERFLQIFMVSDVGATALLVPTKLAQDIERIEKDKELTREQKDLMIAQARLGAVASGLMLIGGVAAMRAGAQRQRAGAAMVDENSPALRQQIELLEMEGFGKYQSMQERGWIDAAGNWTDKAPDIVRSRPTAPTAPAEQLPPARTTQRPPEAPVEAPKRPAEVPEVKTPPEAPPTERPAEPTKPPAEAPKVEEPPAAPTPTEKPAEPAKPPAEPPKVEEPPKAPTPTEKPAEPAKPPAEPPKVEEPPKGPTPTEKPAEPAKPPAKPPKAKKRPAAPRARKQPAEQAAKPAKTKEPAEAGKPKARPGQEPGEPPAKRQSASEDARDEVRRYIREVEQQHADADATIKRLENERWRVSVKLRQLENELEGLKSGSPERAAKLAEYEALKQRHAGLDEEIAGYMADRSKYSEQKARLEEALKLERPALRQATIDKIMAAAPRRNGKFVDPNTDAEIEDDYVFGHAYGHEHRRLVMEAVERRMTQAEFNDWVNEHPEWFQIEDPISNASHKYEKPGLD